SIHCSQQTLVFCLRQPTISPSPWGRASNLGDGVERQPHTPFLDSHGKQVAQQRQFQPDSVVAARNQLAILIRVASQPSVTVLRYDIGAQSSQRILPQMSQQRLRFLVLRDARRFPLSRRHFPEVTLQRRLYRHPLPWRSLYVHSAHHLIFGTPRPVLSITLGAKCLGRSRPARLSNDGFPGARWGLNDGCHASQSSEMYTRRFTTVPKLYLARKLGKSPSLGVGTETALKSCIYQCFQSGARGRNRTGTPCGGGF